MIIIHPSPTADTRTCDVTKVTREQLLESSREHIGDVAKGLAFLASRLVTAAAAHDYDKLSDIDWFYEDFQTGFAKTGWWQNHRQIHRHHLNWEDGVPADVNLLDVLEYIVDCVMAGMARSGSVYELTASDELLRDAFRNTVELVKMQVEVAPTPTPNR